MGMPRRTPRWLRRWGLSVGLGAMLLLAFVLGSVVTLKVGPLAAQSGASGAGQPMAVVAQADTTLDGATPEPVTTLDAYSVYAKAPASCDPAAARGASKVVVVCLREQWLFAYQNGRLVFNAPVETGRPQLPTPTGTYSIFRKATNITFISPFPKGSPYYYYPTHINYAMEFRTGGFYLHDAWWHEEFGPGSNVPHRNPDGTWETGSHGCVGMTIANAKWLYGWTKIGTRVVVTKL